MDHHKLTDQEVVERARKGRESAFRELIRRYERPVFSLIYRLVRDRERAEDLAQDTFIKVLNALDRYDPTFKFSSWIFKIAHNTALDDLRRKHPETLSIHGSPHASTADELERAGPVDLSAVANSPVMPQSPTGASAEESALPPAQAPTNPFEHQPKRLRTRSKIERAAETPPDPFKDQPSAPSAVSEASRVQSIHRYILKLNQPRETALGRVNAVKPAPTGL